MVCEGIVLRHYVSKEGLEVDKAKISTIENFSPPKNVKVVRIFLGHVGFYRKSLKTSLKL